MIIITVALVLAGHVISAEEIIIIKSRKRHSLYPRPDNHHIGHP